MRSSNSYFQRFRTVYTLVFFVGLCKISVFAQEYGVVDLQAGLVAHWRCDQAEGQVLRDVVGEHHGRISGKPKWVPNSKMPHLSLTSGFVSVPHHEVFARKATDSFTIAGWYIYTPDRNYSILFMKRNSKVDGIWIGIRPGGMLQFRAGAKVVPGKNVRGGWTHLAMVQDGKAGTRRLYINGRAQKAQGRSTNTVSLNPLLIGANGVDKPNPRNWFSDIRWYNRALTAAELRALALGSTSTTVAAKPAPKSLTPQERLEALGPKPSIEEMLAMIDVMLEAEKMGKPAAPVKSNLGTDRTRTGSGMDVQLAQIEKSLLKKSVETYQGRKGISAWQSASKAWQLVMVNSTATEHVLQATVGPKSVNVHPPAVGAIGIAWRSPIDGTLAINGRLTDSHAGGDSIAWKLHHLSDKAVTPLAEGAVAPLGKQMFSDVTVDKKPLRVSVNAGDIVQLTVLPKTAYTCDLTRVEWILSEVGGRRRKWDITKDLVPDLLDDGKGNPHRDTFGNRNVWYFFDVPPERIMR
jgi:hypothetical protein